MKKNIWRVVIEVGFIVFLFYSNLLMGEFERSGLGQKRGLAWAIEDVFTAANFEIAMIAALIGQTCFLSFSARNSRQFSSYLMNGFGEYRASQDAKQLLKKREKRRTSSYFGQC